VRVYGGTIKTTDGQIEQIALKSFSSYQQAQDAYRQVGMLRPVFESEAGARFNRVVVAGVDCKAPKGSSNRLNLPNAILMERATGASHQLQDLNLTVEEAALDSREFRRKIKVIKKFRDQNLEALNALKKHGLVHSDIKPSNILYKLVPGTNPAKLTEDQIEFQIADYDGVVHNGQRIKVSTHEYRSPETLEVKEIAGKKAVLNMASNEQDLYALGNSVFELVSGDHPIDYYSS
jgi:serine/threonine protein kinase